MKINLKFEKKTLIQHWLKATQIKNKIKQKNNIDLDNLQENHKKFTNK